MKINLFGREAISSTNGGYRWPATKADSGYNNSSSGNYYGGTVPALRMGALLAIRSVDFDALVASFETGKTATAPAVILARAMRDYGTYVVDNTAWDSIAIVTEWGPDGRVKDEFKLRFGISMDTNAGTPWWRDLDRIMNALQIVDSNAHATPSGGAFDGTANQRRAPLAPGFGTPGCGDSC